MKAVARKQTSNDTLTRRRIGVKHTPTLSVESISVFPSSNMFIQRKPICPCDGGCPRCVGIIQPKLIVGQPDDKYEQEADHVADEVMRMPEPGVQRQVEPEEEEEETLQPKALASQITALVRVQRQEEPEEEEEELQAKPLSGTIQRQGEEEEEFQTKAQTGHTPSINTETHRRIHSLKDGGQALPPQTQRLFESRMGKDFSGVRIHADSKAAGTAQSVQARAFTVGKNIVFNAGQYAPDSHEGKRLLAHELTHVVQQSTKSSTLQRKVDFEFDLNYGTEDKWPATSSKANGAQKWSKTPITKHRRKDSSGKMKDGFKVVQDGNRIEITTHRFGLESEGRSKLTKTMDNIMAFVGQLETACSSAPLETVSTPADSVNRTGKPLGRSPSFTLPVSEDPDRVFVPLGGKRSPTYFRCTCSVSAAPQATLDVTLGNIEDLVAEIRATKGKPPGEGLTGGSRYRAGARSDALFDARDAVNRDWIRHRGHTTLSDGIPVTSANFTPRLKGFMILMVSYLRTSMITYGRDDYEIFAKAYPPIVTHTRFRDMYHRILNDDERKVFEELYGGTASARDKLFALAGKPSGGATERLFPAKAQPKQERIFGRPLFWDDLVKMTMSDTPLTKASGRESLFTPLASATKGPTRAGPKKVTPLQILTLGLFGEKRREKVGTRLELRRIGFNWVPASKWRGLTDMVFDLARRLNR